MLCLYRIAHNIPTGYNAEESYIILYRALALPVYTYIIIPTVEIDVVNVHDDILLRRIVHDINVAGPSGIYLFGLRVRHQTYILLRTGIGPADRGRSSVPEEQRRRSAPVYIIYYAEVTTRRTHIILLTSHASTCDDVVGDSWWG